VYHDKGDLVDQAMTVVIGAGPHGLAAAAQFGRAGVETRVLGDPMSFWRAMPAGMLLRSSWTASSIAEHDGPLSLDSYCAARDKDLSSPVRLEDFLEYGAWVQRAAVPDVDTRAVVTLRRDADRFVLTLDDGTEVSASRVVVAAGIAPFAHLPAVGQDLPEELASHTSRHRDLSTFRGRSVLVVGGGQSALESAALMHESGADVEVVARAESINWLHGGRYQRKLGRLAPLLYAPTDVGPAGISRVVAAPDLFRRLPRAVQESMASRAIRPAGAAWLRSRLREVPLRLGTSLRSVAPRDSRLRVGTDDGAVRLFDHLMFGTGYRVDVSRYPFLSPELTAQVRSVQGYPVLGRGLESSVPGLYFMGAPAARSFGPLMRFVSGSWYAARAVTRSISGGPAPAPEQAPPCHDSAARI
jgi:FAD-dependent urate hydroxylase